MWFTIAYFSRRTSIFTESIENYPRFKSCITEVSNRISWTKSPNERITVSWGSFNRTRNHKAHSWIGYICCSSHWMYHCDPKTIVMCKLNTDSCSIFLIIVSFLCRRSQGIPIWSTWCIFLRSHLLQWESYVICPRCRSRWPSIGGSKNFDERY